MAELKNNIFNNNIAGDTSNILIPDTSAIKSGVVFKANIDSNVLNGYYNLLSKAVQFLQFTGGLYSEEADYDEGNITSLVIKNGEDYSIWQFRRNANNPQVLNNNPPISGASITTVNGVDAYEGGSLNTDWDKLTEDYAVEATPNTVMGRDGEGASNVNMPSNIENTTVVNNQYLQQQLQEQLQAGLATKQDKLTAGTNITISEDNVISASGDLATRADLVTYDNSNTNLQYTTGYDFPKFKIPIPDTINLVLTDNIKEYPATITKNEDGSYILNSSIDNYNIADTTPAIMLFVKSIDGNSNSYQMYSTFSQFFEFSDNNNFIFYNLEKEECNISNTNINFKVSMIMANIIGIMLIKEDETEFEQGNYNIILNIKNRVLKNEDANLFVSNSSNLYTLSFINDNGNIKLTGKITTNGKYTTTELLGFYSPIIENYFNLSSILGNTVGITSSSGKALKFCVIKGDASNNNLALYMFSIAYQDGSNIQEGDVFTFNLTPDKNSTLDPIYSSVSNVQEAIEAIVQRLILLESYNKNIEGV
ncbi:hypothetical protein [Brachyspira hyodysenteriae]|uniref:hypothetical protein n=1 Tax=Brachyspira hyodysenteriae TaxID=159 RepID=UPI0022CD3C50|nr:hypothetical protein [Brachyspira hyodysenteriae]MCZ9850161.1 hypothetical protein [Brachyspira hyodysenteriae]MCZ9894580.1 hypothetical protein [Brachyspira hyodysenteriae]MCZ9951875.1 hypothetical protein [Brachyspira hyodysenteriae]MCZ9970780.1 hypothetical protein [Brachyspira hyodysenteriae]MCZ9974947.1 hypothetical protein [Brachyspira hyodysenteriae]